MTTHLEHLGYPLEACTPPHGPIQLALGVRLASHYPIQVEKLEVCAHARISVRLRVPRNFFLRARFSGQQHKVLHKVKVLHLGFAHAESIMDGSTRFVKLAQGPTVHFDSPLPPLES